MRKGYKSDRIYIEMPALSAVAAFLIKPRRPVYRWLSYFPAMDTIRLRTGASMPILGLGTWQAKPEETKMAVETAIDSGYRLIDTALAYQNEASIGNALKGLFDKEIIDRSDVFITTKNWVTLYHKDDVKPSLEKSLEALQLEFVDLYLLHAPCAMKRGLDGGMEIKDGRTVPDPVDLLETWKGMEQVYNEGLAKAIGVSNFNQEQIQRIWDNASVKPHNLQVELHVYFPQFELHQFCKDRNITVTSYATLTSPGRKNFQLPNRTIEWNDPGSALEDPKVVSIASEHKKSPAQVLLRWASQRGIAVIPKSVNPERIKQNAQIWDFKLSKEDMETLNCLSVRERLFKQDWCIGHPEDPFKDERKL